MNKYNIDLTSEKMIKKISFILLNIWVLYPLLMMILTYKFSNDLARNIMFYLLNFIGVSGIIIGIVYFYKRKNNFNLKKHLIYILGIILLIWLTITSFFSSDYMLTFTGELYRKEGLQTYFYYSGVFILSLILKEENKRIKLFNRLLFVEIIIAIISLFNNNITHLLTDNIRPYEGIFSNSNHYGYYLMFGIIISIVLYLNNNKLINKIIYLLSYILLLYTLILNDTFGCFLALTISIILMLYFYKNIIKKIGLIILIFIILCFSTYKNGTNIVYKNISSLLKDTNIIKNNLINTKITKKSVKSSKDIDNIGTKRGKLWRYGIKYILKKPITGYGIEMVQLLYSKDGIPITRPHNILIQMGVASGIPGILLYLSFILLIFYRNFKNKNNLNTINIGIYLVCICYFISSMFGNSMFYTSPYFMIFLGMLTSNTYLKNKKNVVN